MKSWNDMLKALGIIVIMLGIPISLIIFDLFQLIGFSLGIIWLLLCLTLTRHVEESRP